MPQDGVTARVGKLKRQLTLFDVTMYGVGIILGAGIYALIGPAAGLAGNALWMSFGLAAIIAALTGLSYAELTALFPRASAEYLFTQKAFRNRLFSFLVGWLMMYVTVVAAATVALGFGGYMYSLTGIPVIAASLGLIALLTIFNLYGIKESSRLNILLTTVEVFGLLLILFLAFGHYGSVNYFETAGIPNGIFLAAILVFFAYLGFEDMDAVSEETRNPRRTIPIALLLAVAISTVLYMAVSIAAVSILPWQKLAVSSAPMADVAGAVVPGAGWFLSLIALAATSSTVLILLIAGSRLTYGMATEGSLPKLLKAIHPVRCTPWIAVLLVGSLSALLTLTGSIKMVAELTDIGAFAIFTVVNAAVIVLRYTKPHERRLFKIPLNIGRFPVLPAIGMIFCAYMLTHFSVMLLLSIIFILVLGAAAHGLLVRTGKIKN